MVNVGIAGIGFMGVTHFKALAEIEGAKVTAVCTRNEKKLAGDWSTVKGNFGDAGGVQDMTGIAAYRDLADLIADDTVELLDICLPTQMHLDVTLAALEAGKHVLVEKPIAMTLEEADRMIDAAAANGRRLMVAHVVRFIPQWLYVKRLIESGEYGRLLGLSLKRVITMPDWTSDTRDWKNKGGPLTDLHIHDVDYMLYLLGPPKRLVTLANRRDGVITYYASTYDYGEGLTADCRGGVTAVKGRQFVHGFEAYFERATVTHIQATEPADIDPRRLQSGSQALTVYHPDGSAEFPQLDGEDGFLPQLKHAVECIASDRVSPIIDARFAREALALVLEEAKSIESGQMIDLNGL